MSNIFDQEVKSNSESSEINDNQIGFTSSFFKKQDDLLFDLFNNTSDNKKNVVIKETISDFFAVSKTDDKQSTSLVTSFWEANISLNDISKNIVTKSKTPSNLFANSDIVLRPWKNIENVPARLVSFSENHVILECLVDKEKMIYEERSFRPSLFIETKLYLGKLFYLRLFERANELKIQIHEDPSLILDSDFPRSNLSEKYKGSKIFNTK